MNALQYTLTEDMGDLLQITGHMVDISILQRMGLADIKDRLTDLIAKFRELELDANEFTCLKFLILLNPGKCPSFAWL